MAETNIPKAYDPKTVEPYWADYWIEQKLAEPDPKSGKKTHVIVIPPPNVTGSLHMGHALNNTLQDALTRWKKMSGFDALWVPGTDHGGIATQNVVEKMLKAEKISRYDLGRDKFLERMWKWRGETGDTILMQLRKLGAMLDWSRTRFTMDEVCSKAVGHAFMDFYKQGWIYRGKRMVNWCVRCRTALSDIEVEYEDRKDKLYHIRYPILSGKKDGWQGVPLVVATTRPETLLGDQAVAVHPDDERYEKIGGWWIQLPLTDREIPVIKDSAIDPKFGTGVVKVTPAHDPIDFEMGERHRLEQLVVIGFDGKMTAAAGKYAGLSREEARKKILEDLEAQNLIEKIEDYAHAVGTCYRCGVVVEPLVSDQWFMKMDDMAKSAIQATKSGKVKIYPESWEKPYMMWLENLKDWCISRQIWWGHRIPIWYCIDDSVQTEGSLSNHPAEKTNCPPIPSTTQPAGCPKCKSAKLEQDPDVLDTWFSSGLWPMSVFKWPDQTEDLKRYYPTSVLVTGHEILYLWVARMVMMGLHFMKDIPYSHVFIHGIVRDKQGKKMSKSLGNVIDPLTMMDKFGTDALRFVLTSQSVPGRDMQISDDTFVGARNFANKIWNVSRFVLSNVEAAQQDGSIPSMKLAEPDPQSLELCDRWILSRLQQAIASVLSDLEQYNLSQASRTLYHFIWSEFCDWYIELSKIRMMDAANPAARKNVLTVLIHLLDNVLRLLHPIMPFITEEVSKNLHARLENGRKDSLLRAAYPEAQKKWIDAQAENEMAVLMEAITAVRTIRSEMNVPPVTKIRITLRAKNADAEKLLNANRGYLQTLCKSDDIQIGMNLAKPAKSAAAVFKELDLFIPLEGIIDFEKEKERLAKERANLENQLSLVEKRLSDPQFKTNAPEEEVKRTEARKLESQEKLKRLEEHIASIV